MTGFRVAIHVLVALSTTLVPAMAAFRSASAATLALVGDSTVAEWDTSGEKRGWGQKLGGYLGPGVVVLNEAQNGRSSKSFIERYDEETETTIRLWDDVLALSPDYVLVQFGHNDIPGKLHETDPGPVPDPLPPTGFGSSPLDWYRENMRKYVNESRAIGAFPIIVTPMERRRFDPAVPGTIRLINAPYAQAARDVAQELVVPVVDLHAFSIDLYEGLYQEVGDDSAGEYLHATGDVTHFNNAGANVYANAVASMLTGTPLEAHVTLEAVPLGSVGRVALPLAFVAIVAWRRTRFAKGRGARV